MFIYVSLFHFLGVLMKGTIRRIEGIEEVPSLPTLRLLLLVGSGVVFGRYLGEFEVCKV